MDTRLHRALNRLHQLEDLAMLVALMLLLAVAFLQILLRNFFDTGIIWADSFLRTLVLWVTLLGAMIATRERHHISIDLVTRYLNDKYHPLVNCLTGGFASVVCLVTAWYALELVKFEYEDGMRAFGIIPVWLTQSILPFGFAVMSLRFAWQFIESANGIRQLIIAELSR